MDKRFVGVICAFMLVLVLPIAEAGQRPDFSGTWAATREAPAALAAAPAPILGQQLAIQHEGAALTVIRRVRETLPVSTTYSLNGAKVHSRIPGALCMADSEVVETAVWDGNTIVLTIVASVPPGGGAAKESSIERVLRLDTADRLVVEGIEREGGATGATRAVATVYRRTSAPGPASTAAASPAKPAASIAQVSWLSGVWVGASGSEERWTPAASGAMLGISRTQRGGVVTEFEFLCIVERGGGLVYQAMPGGRSPATDFTLTAIGSDHVTFENPRHDFPKALRYTRRADGTLEAVVSGDPKDPTLTFSFRKQGS
jgi:hypothetical protein